MSNSISAPELSSRIQRGETLQLIDVRTPVEFGAGHIPGAINLPLDTLSADRLRAVGGSNEVVFICKGGTRGGKACEQAGSWGVQARNLTGGTDGWVNAGFPVNGSGKETISLERQVRIAAGTMVAIGTALGWTLSPNWLALPLFVGCGLVFAGVTDTCGMGMMIARMPWNQSKSCSTKL